MDIPLQLDIKFLKGYNVCHFKDIQHDVEAPPHFYITIPCKDDAYLVLCIITSQVERKKDYYRNNLRALNSLIEIDKNDFSFLSGKSIVDCNTAEYMPRNVLIRKIDSNYGFKIKARNIVKGLKDKLLKGIFESPLVSTYTKNNILIS